MKTRRNTGGRWTGLLGGLLVLAGCSSEGSGGDGGTGGSGVVSGGGGASTSTGGASATGGTAPATGGTAGAMNGSGGGVSGTGCAGALFCDDFEAYGDTGNPGGEWSVQVNDAQLSMDTERAVSGTKSVKVTAGGGSGRVAYLILEGAPVFPVAGNHYFGRMRVWLDSAPTEAVNWNFIEGEGVVAGEPEYRAQYRYGGQYPISDNGMFLGSQLKANYETPDWDMGMGPGSDCWAHSDAVVMPAGDWTCVEWEFDGPNDTMRLWLDGVAIESATVAGSGEGCVNAAADFEWTAPTFQELHLGWQAFQNDSERTLWIDDVALGTERVGCEQ